jgi:hypothetical protein
VLRPATHMVPHCDHKTAFFKNIYFRYF